MEFPIGCLPGWRIGECSPDMEGTGEIKYPGQTKTSIAALRLTEGSVKPRGRKPWKKNHLVLQVGGCAKGQLAVHVKHLQVKNSQRRNGTGRLNGCRQKRVQRNTSNEDKKLDSLRPGSREMERGRWEGQNFQLGSTAPGRRRRKCHSVSLLRRYTTCILFLKAPYTGHTCDVRELCWGHPCYLACNNWITVDNGSESMLKEADVD